MLNVRWKLCRENREVDANKSLHAAQQNPRIECFCIWIPKRDLGFLLTCWRGIHFPGEKSVHRGKRSKVEKSIEKKYWLEPFHPLHTNRKTFPEGHRRNCTQYLFFFLMFMDRDEDAVTFLWKWAHYCPFPCFYLFRCVSSLEFQKAFHDCNKSKVKTDSS